MNQSVSQALRQTRLKRNQSLEEISKAIRIRQPYLEALEAGDFDALPSSVQARGFLRTYAEYLGLDPAPMLAALGYRASPSPDSPFQAAMHPPPKTGLQPGDEESLANYLPNPIVNVPIFQTIGELLRQQREILGLSLGEVEAHTLIRLHYLQAIENGNFSILPSLVQGRGMLNNYAIFLGLDTETLLLQYAEGIQAGFRARQPVRPQTQPRPTTVYTPAPHPSAFRRFFSTDLLWGFVLLIMLTGFIGWGVLTILAARETETAPMPSPPSVADVLLMTVTPSPSATIVTPTNTEAAIFYPSVVVSGQPEGAEGTPGAPPIQDVSPGKVHLNVVIHRRTWLRVTVDGKVQFEGRAIPGSAYPFSANDAIELLTGNAAGVQVYYNQQDLGILGYLNQVVMRIYTPAGVLNPTPTITLTPTITPTPTATPRFTVAPTVTQ